MAKLQHGNVVLPLPAGWNDTSRLIIVGPAEGATRPNLVLTREKAKAGVTAKQLAQSALAPTRAALPGLTVVKEEERSFGTNKGFLREQLFTDASKRKLRQLVFFMVKAGTGYTAVVTHQDESFATFRPSAEAMLGEIQLL